MAPDDALQEKCTVTRLQAKTMLQQQKWTALPIVRASEVISLMTTHTCRLGSIFQGNRDARWEGDGTLRHCFAECLGERGISRPASREPVQLQLSRAFETNPPRATRERLFQISKHNPFVSQRTKVPPSRTTSEDVLAATSPCATTFRGSREKIITGSLGSPLVFGVLLSSLEKIHFESTPLELDVMKR